METIMRGLLGQEQYRQPGRGGGGPSIPNLPHFLRLIHIRKSRGAVISP